MIKNICGDDYFCVPVTIHTAWNRKEERIVRRETERAKREAEQAGYNPDTIQRMVDGFQKFYVFK